MDLEPAERPVLGVYSRQPSAALISGAQHLADRLGYRLELNPPQCLVGCNLDDTEPRGSIAVRFDPESPHNLHELHYGVPGRDWQAPPGAPRGILAFSGSVLEGSTQGARDPHVPVVDLLELAMLGQIKEAAERLGVLLPVRPLWPGSRPFAIGLSHDVDRIARTFQLASHPARMLAMGRPLDAAKIMKDFVAGRDDFWGFPEVIEIEERSQALSTWFWLREGSNPAPFRPSSWKKYYGRYSWSSTRVRGIIKELAGKGHEIGVHNSLASITDPVRNSEDRARLSEMSGYDVVGCRQHYLVDRLTERWTALVRAGFGYDSSAGYANDWGFRLGTCLPVRPMASGHGEFVELPLGAMDRAVARDADWASTVPRILEAVERVGGCLVLDWHSNVFGRAFRGFAEAYRLFLREGRRRNAWISPLGEIATWWRARVSQTEFGA